MALNELEQITQVLGRSKQILITFPKNYSIDAVASALALALVLKKQGKVVDIVADGFTLNDNLKFLPQAELIMPRLTNLQKFVIELNNNHGEIEDLSYDMKDGKLKIYITPKTGAFREEDVSAKQSKYKYDLIITLDTSDLESLGNIYQDQPDFFYTTDILNIDHKADNEHFGQINLVYLSAVSTTGVLFELIEAIDIGLLDNDIATCILTGLTSKTRSFKTPSVTPQALTLASKLLEAGADKDKIIKNLYRSRNINTMNLWGRVLARLKNDKGNKLIWSILSENDFIESKTTEAELTDVVDELISFVPDGEVVILIYQLAGKNNVIINTLKGQNALYLGSKFKAVGNKNVTTFISDKTSLKETEEEIIEEIKTKLGQI